MSGTDYLNDLFTLYPELILTVTVLVVLTADLFLSRRSKWLLTPLTIFGLLLTGIGCFFVWGVNDTVFNGFYVVDDLSVFFKAATVVIGVFAVLFVPSYLRQRNLPLGEHNVILMFALLGMFVLASSADLITLFIGLELMTMPSYLLTGFHKTDRYSNEGGLKYFLLGSFASAILLFGISWTFGLTGSTNIAVVAKALAGQPIGPAHVVALAMLTVGGTFKIAAVPFHYWTPDAYQGAPTPITGFLSVGPKLGAFALLVRVFAEALAPLRSEWLVVMSILAVVTMTGGNIVALVQTNVKRMLAYSSIAHTGYIMVGTRHVRRGQHDGGPAPGDRGDPVLRPRLRRDEHRGLRGGGHAAARPAPIRRARVVRGPRVALAGARRGDGDPPPQPHRHPADGRILREVVRAHRCR